MKKTQHKQKGFTLIETLVAIFLLLVVVTGPLAFTSDGLKASFFSRDQVVAFYLAQDALETIKNIRDNQVLSNPAQDWFSAEEGNLSLETGTVKKIIIDTSGSNVQFAECGNACPPLYFNSVTGEYTQSAGSNNSQTKYTRTVYLVELVENQEIQIIVEVTWDSNFFGDRRVVVQENIYNWASNILNS